MGSLSISPSLVANDLSLSVLLLGETFYDPTVWQYREMFQGVQRILERLGSEEEVALMAFNGKPRLVQEFTRDRDQLYQRLLRLEAEEAHVEDHNFIPSLLHAAILGVARYALKATEPRRRRAVVVFTCNVARVTSPRLFGGGPEGFEKRRQKRRKLEQELRDVLYGSDGVAGSSSVIHGRGSSWVLSPVMKRSG